MQEKAVVTFQGDVAKNRSDLGEATVNLNAIEPGIIFKIIVQTAENKDFPFFYVQIFDSREEDSFILNWDIYPGKETIASMLVGYVTPVDAILLSLNMAVNEGIATFRKKEDVRFTKILDSVVDQFEMEVNKGILTTLRRWADENHYKCVEKFEG